MTPDERQALREKHRSVLSGFCNYCWDSSDNRLQFSREPYPCDVIKVLDAIESQITECEHEEVADYDIDDNLISITCPKCGEKL